MAPTRTRTVKNKHSAAKAGASGGGSGGKGAKRSATDGISKPRSGKPKSGPPQSQQLKEKNRALLQKKPKKKTYTEAELNIPKLNTVTPVGVVKPKGKKKGKVFVDDTESMGTILAMVQAEKNGQIESKMIKARQMEEIREARKAEAEKKDAERKSKLEDTKQSLRKKRKRNPANDDGDSIKNLTLSGSKASKPKKKVAFA
ncbi:60S ribosomal subunit assembly/export protein loc1 [Purpureocillium lavendulum]|uniref:60S ribosomal subunit assembly/export protein loc1 n=1 Tax=Purpureocillium lavendulum TaxID=1247861 RepID=A0AB34FGZ9_9HYPO|nr:60S ribosomal subunit assembly/export protein loc1 [Purpureocillium lavendulum]